MLSIVATLIIGLSGVLVFFVDESKRNSFICSKFPTTRSYNCILNVTGQTAFGLSFVILICACAITLHGDYYKDDVKKLGGLKFYCILSMALICFHLGIAGFRLGKYYDDGDRFAIITLINFVAAQSFLIYSIVCTMTTLKKTKERTPLTNQHV